MNLHRLRCAVAIADHGSFSDAAVHLDLSQPTLSHAISKLEEELGVRLFDRTPSGTRPTAAGERMLGPARRALQEADNVRASIEAATGLLTGELRVAGIRTAVPELAEHAAEFHRRYEKVRIIINGPGGDDDVITAIRGGVADVGLMRANAVPDELVSVPMGDQQVVVAFPAGTAPRTRRVTLDSLSGVDVIAPVAGSRVRQVFGSFIAALEVPPRIVAESSDQETTLELARHGVGAALASEKAIGAHTQDGLDIRPVSGLRIPLAVVTTRWPSPAALAFRELVRLDRSE